MTNWLLGGGKPVLVLAAMIAAVGISGTAWANKGNSGNDGKGKSAKTDGGKWHKGSKGATGDAPGDAQDTQTAQQGAQAPQGSWGDKGQSDNWWKWHKKHKKGHGHPTPPPAPAPEYGVATVNVSRGGQPANVWATYSTALGSPVGDTTGGTFRFTCATNVAPCTVAIGAAVLSSDTGTASVYPRVLIYRQDYDAPGPEIYCEYGDGSTDVLPMTLTKQVSTATPTYALVPLNIGGSADCGGPDPTAGNVNQITVPAGYYDVHSTFQFFS